MSQVLVEKGSAHPITVKIVSMGAGITQYVADTSMTLGQLLEQLAVSGQTDVRVNGLATDPAYRLANGDEVLLVPKIRGGGS
ncbi:MAG: MoaD/ThiS family protein [Candidatus Methylomirabilales bacterium]